MHSICVTTNRRLRIIKKTIVSRDRKLLLTLYKYHVRSILEYGCVIWCPCTKKNIDFLERVQKRFCHIYSRIFKITTTEASYQSLTFSASPPEDIVASFFSCSRSSPIELFFHRCFTPSTPVGINEQGVTQRLR